MMIPLPKLISLDVGGTLGFVRGQTITAILASISSLPSSEVRHILRSTLLVSSKITDLLIDTLCDALKIDRASFPRDYISPSLQLYPWALSATRSLSRCAPVVTLSNVSCLDFDFQSLQGSLGNYITAHYPSCELGYAKPDPRAFKSMVELQGISPTSLVHIGDNWECDILGALAIGAQAIWISGGRSAPSDKLTMYSERLTIVRDLTDASKHLCAMTTFPTKTTYIHPHSRWEIFL